MGVDEPISVVSYNPIWPRLFEQEQVRIRAAIGDRAIEIEHFGSTAVPGLAAKAIVDILVGVAALELETQQREALAQVGNEYLGEAGVSGRLALRKRRPHNFNLAVVEWNGPLWRDNLLLRDYLRTHPQQAQDYEQHKHKLMEQGISTLLRYSEAKGPVIDQLLRQAQAWHGQQNL